MFAEPDIERMAYAGWLWDLDRGFTTSSWQFVKDLYRERAEFVAEFLNRSEVAA